MFLASDFFTFCCQIMPFLDFLLIYALLLQNLVVLIYAIFSADFLRLRSRICSFFLFSFRMYGWVMVRLRPESRADQHKRILTTTSYHPSYHQGLAAGAGPSVCSFLLARGQMAIISSAHVCNGVCRGWEGKPVVAEHNASRSPSLT